MSVLLAYAALLALPQGHCSAPIVVLTGNEKRFITGFWAGTPRRRDVEDNVRAAFKSACKYGLLTGSTIAPLQNVSTQRLFLENQPNANGAMLEADQLPDGSWRLVLSYPFVGADRRMHLPSAAQIQDAIYCAVHGASAKQQEESGRCLPD